MSDNIKTNLSRRSTWRRGLYMLLFAIFYGIAEVVLTLIVLFQFLLQLISGDVNVRLRQLGLEIAAYLYQITRYLTFNSEQLVYPFSEWPQPRANKPPGDDDLDDMLRQIEQDDNVDGD